MAETVFAVFGMGGEPLAQLGGIGLQVGDALGLFLSEVGFDGLAACFAMWLKHDAGSGFEFGGIMFEVGAGDEGNVIAADGFDALAVSKQNHIEQHGRRIGGGTRCVVVEPRIEAG